MPLTTKATASKKATVTGTIFSGLVVLFLLADAAAKLAKPDAVVKATTELGYQESIIVPLGVTLLIGTLLYAFPRTAVLGAIVLTGYLGGAVATHARLGQPLCSHTLFPVYMGVLLWLGLFLRDTRLRKLVPLRQAAE